MDPFFPGQPLNQVVTADNMNQFSALLNHRNEQKFCPQLRRNTPQYHNENILRIHGLQNNLPRGTAVTVNGLLTPFTDEVPALSGQVASDYSENIAFTTENAVTGFLTPCKMHGVCSALVKIKNTDDTFANVSDNGILNSQSQSGPFRLLGIPPDTQTDDIVICPVIHTREISTDIITYPCKNVTNETLPQNCAVAFDLEHSATGRILRVKKARDYLEQWGILLTSLQPGESGSVIVNGVITLTVNGGSGNFIAPDWDNPGTLIRSTYGEPLIGIVDTEKMIVRLTGVIPFYDSNSPFHCFFDKNKKLICNGGWWYRLIFTNPSDTEPGSLNIRSLFVDGQNFGQLPVDTFKYIVFSPDESQIVLRDDTETGDVILATYDNGGISNRYLTVVITAINQS